MKIMTMPVDSVDKPAQLIVLPLYVRTRSTQGERVITYHSFESVVSKGGCMKYRILGLIAGLISIVAAFMPQSVRHFLLYKVKNLMYLVFG